MLLQYKDESFAAWLKGRKQITVSSAVRLTGMGRGEVRGIIKRLEEQGLVEAIEKGRERLYRAIRPQQTDTTDTQPRQRRGSRRRKPQQAPTAATASTTTVMEQQAPPPPPAPVEDVGEAEKDRKIREMFAEARAMLDAKKPDPVQVKRPPLPPEIGPKRSNLHPVTEDSAS